MISTPFYSCNIFQGVPIHRVQRSPGNLPLLRELILILARYHQPFNHVQPAYLTNTKGRVE